MFTAEHAKNGIEFDPAVWKPMELQKFLIHAIMHEAYDHCEGQCMEYVYGTANAVCSATLQCKAPRM